jgi:hypothetical protein
MTLGICAVFSIWIFVDLEDWEGLKYYGAMLAVMVLVRLCPYDSLSLYLSDCLVYLSASLSVCLSVCLPHYLFVCQSAHVPMCLSACLPSCLPV